MDLEKSGEIIPLELQIIECLNTEEVQAYSMMLNLLETDGEKDFLKKLN